MPELSLFAEIALLVTFAAGVGIVGTLLRQPLVVSFIAAGLLAGPDALGLVRAAAPVHLLADLGVALLLFVVGLKLDVRTVRTLGAVAAVTGIGQVVFTSAIGFALCLALGLSTLESVYVAVALTFSSTIIIVKLLTDKREIDALHGRIAVGFLIVQDLVVVVAMVVLAASGVPAAGPGEGAGPLGVLLRGLALVAFALVLVRPLAERLTARLGRSPELLATAAIAWTLALSAIADHAGLGKELGGLLAGATLGSTGARDALAARLSGLRDFLLLFFFLALGAALDLDALATRVPAALVLSVFVLVGNPLIVMALMGWLGYRGRTGLLAGLTVAQISEFSLVFVGVGAKLGHVDGAIVGLVTLVGLVTIAGSTYMILYSHRIVALLGRGVRIFERRVPHREEEDRGLAGTEPVDVVVFGFGRYGSRIARLVAETGRHVLVVDFGPDVVRAARGQGFDALYGDASDADLLESVPEARAAIVVALPPALPLALDVDARAHLVAALRARRLGADPRDCARRGRRRAAARPRRHRCGVPVRRRRGPRRRAPRGADRSRPASEGPRRRADRPRGVTRRAKRSRLRSASPNGAGYPSRRGSFAPAAFVPRSARRPGRRTLSPHAAAAAAGARTTDMATIDIKRSHALGKDKARAAAEAVARRLKDKIDATYRWKGDDLEFERSGAKGRIAVSDTEVRVQVELGLLLGPLKGKIEDKVHQYLDEYLK
jgi:putative polyhydroxyalkanoate system protein